MPRACSDTEDIFFYIFPLMNLQMSLHFSTSSLAPSVYIVILTSPLLPKIPSNAKTLPCANFLNYIFVLPQKYRIIWY